MANQLFENSSQKFQIKDMKFFDLTYQPNRKESVVVQVKEFLRQLILQKRLKSGEKLPSQRQICLHLGLNRVTLTNAIDDLIREGLLISKQRKGVFVKSTKIPLVGMCKDVSASQYMSEVEEPEFKTANSVFSASNVRVEMFKFLRNKPLTYDQVKDCEGYLLCNLVDQNRIQILVDTGKPVVAIDVEPLTSEFTGIIGNSFRAGFLATHHLLELGHKRILFVAYHRGITPKTSADLETAPDPDYQKIYAGYRHAMINARLPVLEKDVIFEYPDDSSEMKKILKNKISSEKVTGALIWSYTHILEKLGIEVPADLSVVIPQYMDNKKWTYCTYDRDIIYKTGYNILIDNIKKMQQQNQQTLAQPLSQVITIPTKLIVKSSTRRVGPSLV